MFIGILLLLLIVAVLANPANRRSVLTWVGVALLGLPMLAMPVLMARFGRIGGWGMMGGDMNGMMGPNGMNGMMGPNGTNGMMGPGHGGMHGGGAMHGGGMMGRGGMGWGMPHLTGAGGWVAALLCLAAVIGLIILLVVLVRTYRSTWSNWCNGSCSWFSRKDTALETLRMRLVNGEITPEEYEAIRATLTK